MATNYPGTLDSYSTRVTNGVIAAAHVNDLQDGVVAIETALGTNPKGAAADVAARIAAVEGRSAALTRYRGVSTKRYFLNSPGSSNTSFTASNQRMFVQPAYFDTAITIDRIGLEITTAGTALSVSLGVYPDQPSSSGTYLHFGSTAIGTVALPSTAAGVQEATIATPWTIPTGWSFWAVWCTFSGGTTNFRLADVNATNVPMPMDSAPSAGANTFGGLFHDSLTSMPTTAPSSATGFTSAMQPRLFYRVA